MTGFKSKQAAAQAKLTKDDDIPDYKKPWVGLTDEERASFEATLPKTQEEWDKLFNAIEAKLKEKNA